MIQLLYVGTFALSIVFAGIYIYMWHKHFDVNFNMIFTLVAVSNIGYILQSRAVNVESALAAVQVVYIGGCFLQLFVFLSIFNLCLIEIKKWLRTCIYVIFALIYASVLTPGYSGLFYKEMYFTIEDGLPVFVKDYGPMHTVFHVWLFVLFITGLAALVYAWFRKKQVPRRILILLVLPDIICFSSFFGGRIFSSRIDLVPIGYCLAELIYLLIAYRVNLYNVSDTVIDSMMQGKDVGYISFDFSYRYLGSNEVARRIMPAIDGLTVDSRVGYRPEERKIRHFLEDFKTDPKNDSFLYTLHGGEDDPDGDRYYNVSVGYLYSGSRRHGYIVTFTDDTANRKYIRLLDGYNEELQKEVENKTAHIVKMHDNLIMSLAIMVESRDNSTGGHIKRTSAGVSILVDELKKEGRTDLSPEFCSAVIKAAPMHDLGKIAVDDAVLRKPGRFTDEEFAKMKVHAAEGAKVIHEILLNTDDAYFQEIAENVAHYHHERWDGSGYPEGLAGEQIPLEARIMAIADVYDALVSKRVYKEAFDFDKAHSIILEGMGTQFDPELRDAYEKARPRLEEYYRQL